MTKKTEFHTVPKLFGGVELKEGMTIYCARMEHPAEVICESKFEVAEHKFECFSNWRGQIKDITKIPLYDFVQCSMDQVSSSTKLGIDDIKYYSLTKRGALEAYKQKEVDEAESHQQEQIDRMDSDLKWALMRATDLELEIQQERLKLITRTTQIDIEIEKY